MTDFKERLKGISEEVLQKTSARLGFSINVFTLLPDLLEQEAGSQVWVLRVWKDSTRFKVRIAAGEDRDNEYISKLITQGLESQLRKIPDLRERLDWSSFKKHGFSALPVWGRSRNPVLTFKFPDDTIVKTDLDPNRDGTRFSTVSLPEELKERGLKDVWVEIDEEADQSKIYVLMEGETEPITCMKDYR